jgi:hypothetical protein
MSIADAIQVKFSVWRDSYFEGEGFTSMMLPLFLNFTS